MNPFRPALKSVLERLRSYRHRTEKNAEYAAAAEAEKLRSDIADLQIQLDALVKAVPTRTRLFLLEARIEEYRQRIDQLSTTVDDLHEEIHAGAYGRDLARFHEVVGRISQLEDLTAGLRLARENVAAVTPADIAHRAAELAGELAEPEGPPEPFLTMEQFAALKEAWTGIPATEPSAPTAAEATPEPSTSSAAAADDARRAIQIIEDEFGSIYEDRAAKAVARALLLVHGFDGATALLRL